jgi:hypothetical protein
MASPPPPFLFFSFFYKFVDQGCSSSRALTDDAMLLLHMSIPNGVGSSLKMASGHMNRVDLLGLRCRFSPPTTLIPHPSTFDNLRQPSTTFDNLRPSTPFDLQGCSSSRARTDDAMLLLCMPIPNGVGSSLKMALGHTELLM